MLANTTPSTCDPFFFIKSVNEPNFCLLFISANSLKKFFPSEEILTYAYLRSVELTNDNSYFEITVRLGFKFPGMWYRIVGWVVLSVSMDCVAFIFKGPAVHVVDLWRWRHFDSLNLWKSFTHRHNFTFQKIRILNHTVLKTSSCIHVYLVVVTKSIVQCNSTASYKN